MIGPLEVLQDVVTRLDQKNIAYFLVGSLASMYYGQPRFTNDIDLVVEIKPTQLKEFSSLFPLEEYYCPPEEILRDEILRRGSFNLIHQETQIKIDIELTKRSDFYDSELSRRKKVFLCPGLAAYIASAEDIIIKKLDYYREGNSEKHLNDIRGILVESPVDQEYLQYWITKFGLSEEWKKI